MRAGGGHWLAGVLACVALSASLLDQPSTTQAATPATAGTTRPAPARLATHEVGHRATPRPATTATARTATVVLSGDLLWHNSVWQSAQEDAGRLDTGRRFDFDPMFAAMRPLVAGADLAVCHEEVPFAVDDQHLSNYPVFAAPPEIARWIGSMGWDACTTDSNHSIDQGYAGLVRTADLLETAGVRHVGTFRSPAERRKPVIVTTRQGVRIGIVGGTFGLNGLTLPADKQWAVSFWDAHNLIAQARAAKRAGADIVIVQYHGGDEYSSTPNAQQLALARRLTASPAVDLVFAEHAHVVQPITKVNGKWVVYGMGNMVAQSDVKYPRAYEGITVRFTFTQRGPASDRRFAVTGAAYVRTYWNHYSPGHPIRIQQIDRGLAGGVGDRARLLVAQQEIRRAVHALGATPGLIER